MKHTIFLFLLIISALVSCRNTTQNSTSTTAAKSTPSATPSKTDPAHPKNPYYSRTDTKPLKLSDAEWKKILPADVYETARHAETERAFTGKYWDYAGMGTYYCAACGNALFRSDSKFASTCGWPSFFETIRKNSVIYKPDNEYGMERTEVLCGRCGAHLGHLFDDGPPPTYKRFCMNSIVLDFEPDKKK
ncbi:MAG: peptide-methionine (R)-S-oxide reductase [Bacteroidota bacterium]|nr:peptide-methionine (R)-S-oxide reductase [Bacteroidota bacterium]